MFFQKYIDEEFGNNIKCYEFRAKGNSIPWDCNHVRIIDKLNIATVRSGAKEDNYQRVFHNHTMTPIHCENCKYQIAPRFGDITIGDFWGIQNKDNQINTSKGVAAVMCNNEKGVRFFNEIPSNSIKEKKVVPLSWLCGNGYVTGVSRNYASRYRNTFFEAIKTMTFSQAVNYALKPNHGMYNEIYANSDTILRYDTEFLKWRFETNIWEEHMINGKMLLIVKPNSIGPGHYACMPLSKPLKRGNEYILKIRFKIKSTSHWLNLHVKDSGSNIFQIVHSCNIEGRNWGNEWIDLEIRFKADSNLYDEFMIGASQVSGENNYIAFQYINLKCDTSSK